MRGNQTPTLIDGNTLKTKTPIQVFDKKPVTVTSELLSDAVACGAFRKFSLALNIDSTSTPTTLQVKVQFWDEWTEKWYTYKQGLFASLFYEDTDVANGVQECFQGEVLGRAIRVTLTGVGTTSSAYFTVSAVIDLWN